MRTEPVLILAAFATSLATAVNGLILAFWTNLTEVQAGAVCTAVLAVFALTAALLARGRVYSPQTVEGGPRASGAAPSPGETGQSEHARLAALEPPPPGEVLMADGSYAKPAKPTKRPAAKAPARKR